MSGFDILTTLQKIAAKPKWAHDKWVSDAADEIERLRDEIERLRKECTSCALVGYPGRIKDDDDDETGFLLFARVPPPEAAPSGPPLAH